MIHPQDPTPLREALEPVTQADAIEFAENALRNIDLPRLSKDDLRDIEGGLRAFALKRHRAREALRTSPSQSLWRPISEAKLWDVLVVTDGRQVALAQLAEADFGGPFWSIDPDGGLDWEPTHFATPPSEVEETR